MKKCYTYILLSLFSVLSYAENIDSIARLFEVDEVLVVARQQREILPAQRLEGSALSVQCNQSVADAVRYFSGVQIKDYGGVGGMKTVDVRSMGSQHLGVFYDGIEIGNAQNGTVDLGKFSVDNLESIALYNGQNSDIFRPAKDFSSAGTLYLTSRRPRFEAGKNYNVEVKMRAGTFGLANPSILYEQRLSEHVHLSANAEYTYAHGRYHFRYRRNYPDGSTAWDTTAVRQNGDVQAGRVELGLFGYTDDCKWHVKGYYYQSSRGIPGAIVNNVWKNSQHQWDRNAFVQGNYTMRIGKKLEIQANAKYANDWLRYLNPDTTLQYVDNQFLQQEVYLSVATRYSVFAWWDIAVAADYQLGWLRSDKTDFRNPVRNTLMVSVATSMSYKWFKGQISLLEKYINDRINDSKLAVYEQRKATQHYNALSPTAMLSIKPLLNEEWYIRSFYKSSYRMPTFNDLYYQDNGVANLQPEHSRQTDLGMEWNREWRRTNADFRLGLKADAYYNRVSNKIIAVPKGNSQYRWAMMNIGEVSIWGFEPAADISVSHGRMFSEGGQRPGEISLHLSYTFQQAQDISQPEDNDPYYGTYRGQIAYIPRHATSATVNYRWKDLSVCYSFIYVGSRYTSSANIRENYIQPWYTHDMSINYHIPFRYAPSGSGKHPGGVSVGVEINNIFNQQYEIIPNYPMPGIHGRGIVRLML